MKIRTVEYKALFNLGNYQNETIGLACQLEEGETPEEALKELREKVVAMAQPAAQTLQNERYRLEQSVKELRERASLAKAEWEKVSTFLKSDTDNTFPALEVLASLEPVSPEIEEVRYPDDDDPGWDDEDDEDDF